MITFIIIARVPSELRPEDSMAHVLDSSKTSKIAPFYSTGSS
jgi:hypothetical protein